MVSASPSRTCSIALPSRSIGRSARRATMPLMIASAMPTALSTVSDCPRNCQTRCRHSSRMPVAEATLGVDHFLRQLLAQPADEHFDRIGVAVEVLVVEVLGQLGAAHHLALVVHEVA